MPHPDPLLRAPTPADVQAVPIHFAGFDWLRAIFICLVLLAHLNFFETLAAGSAHPESWNVYDLLRFEVLYLAVPGFLLIATFLQAIKPQDEQTRTKLFTGLFYLYGFWVGAWTLVTHSRPEPSLWGLVSYVLRGGGWAFYFLAALLIVQLIRAAICRWSMRALLLGLGAAVAAILVSFIMLLRDSHGWTRVSTYWWPVCFLPIPFVAHLLARSYSGIISSKRRMALVSTLLVLGTLACAALEWRFAAPLVSSSGRSFLPEYLRMSPWLGATAVVLVSMKVRNAPWLIRFISRNSLGIFCLHVFVLSAVYDTIGAHCGSPVTAGLVTLLVILTGGTLMTEVVRHCMKGRLV